MASYTYLTESDSDELAHMLRIYEGEIDYGNTTSTETVVAIKAVLKSRGEWYCHHDETIEPLEHCTRCGRYYLYVEQPEDDI